MTGKSKLLLALIVFCVSLGIGKYYQTTDMATLGLNDSSSGNIEVIDFSGNTVRLKSPARRIISLAPHITENLFSAGAGDLIAGVVSYSDFPEAAKQLPIVGGYQLINLEKIIDLNPDLIIAWPSGNPDKHTQQLQELGFNVYFDQPDKLSDISKSITDIGLLTARSSLANKAADNYLKNLQSLRQRYSRKEQISVFYQIWNQPLQTINGAHIINDAIELCGGRNIYRDELSLAPVINIESILERDPQVIIASGMSEQRPEWLDEWNNWRELQAVQKENLFFVRANHIQRHSLRILIGIETICQQLNQARTR